MKRALIIPFMAILAGCVSHLSQEQCVSMNWKNEGFNDGLIGKPPRDLTQSITDCAQFSISVNRTEYQNGWKSGAKQYCTPGSDLGYSDAVAGISENAIMSRASICAMANTQLNLASYHSGRKKGLPVFCTYENGYHLARQGKSLPQNVCPSSNQDFIHGWTSGREELCRSGRNAFALGKEGQPYPEACSPEIFASFKLEYDRGAAQRGRVDSIQAEINDADNKISRKVSKYHLLQTHDQYYKLGKDQSEKAKAELEETNSLVRKKQSLERELFKMQMMR